MEESISGKDEINENVGNPKRQKGNQYVATRKLHT